jgi:hypothetical protein
MRLGQIHRAGPNAFHHLGQVFGLELRRGMREQRGDGALREPRIHRERHVGRAKKFVDHFGQGCRQALAAIFGRHRDADPAALDDLLVGLLEAGGRGNAAIGVMRAGFLIADAIERGENFLAELRGFAQHRLHHIGRSVGKTRQIAVAVKVEDVIEQEQGIVHGRFIGRHWSLPAFCRGAGSMRAPFITR